MPENHSILYTIENLYYRSKVHSISIYTVFLAVLVVIIVLLPVIKVDVSNQSRGMVRSFSENVPISTIVSGKVISIHLRNNRNVQKGDTLLILETAPLDSQTVMNTDMQTDLYAVLNDLNKITAGNTIGLQTREIQREYQAYVQKRQELLASLQQAQRVYNRNKNLYDQGVISELEFEKYGYDFQTAQISLHTQEQRQQASWQTQRREIRQQIKNFSGTINQIEANKNNYTITAPISGSILKYNGIQKGTFLNASQVVAEISAHDDLLVEAYVSPNDIGLICKGQTVSIQIDAYNYNQWGMLSGKVTDID